MKCFSNFKCLGYIGLARRIVELNGSKNKTLIISSHIAPRFLTHPYFPALQLNLESVTEDVNDKHLQPWSELCKTAGVVNTPLTPYLDKELLKDNALSVDASKVSIILYFQ